MCTIPEYTLETCWFQPSFDRALAQTRLSIPVQYRYIHQPQPCLHPTPHRSDSPVQARTTTTNHTQYALPLPSLPTQLLPRKAAQSVPASLFTASGWTCLQPHSMLSETLINTNYGLFLYLPQPTTVWVQTYSWCSILQCLQILVRTILKWCSEIQMNTIPSTIWKWIYFDEFLFKWF